MLKRMTKTGIPTALKNNFQLNVKNISYKIGNAFHSIAYVSDIPL